MNGPTLSKRLLEHWSEFPGSDTVPFVIPWVPKETALAFLAQYEKMLERIVRLEFRVGELENREGFNSIIGPEGWQQWDAQLITPPRP